MSAIFSICYWLFFALSAIVLFVPAVLIRLVTFRDPTLTLLHRYTLWWSRMYLKVLPGCRLVVEGRERIPHNVACVLVANHQSSTDIMALGALAVPFKWVSKKEAFKLPFIGWNMWLNQYVSVDRGNVRSVRQTLAECRAWLGKGASLLMFPEGTRSKDGNMHEFHTGSFKLAIKADCPVVPIVVDGTFPIYQGWRVLPFPGTVTIRVLEPVSPAEADKADRLRDLVFTRMQQELASIRQGRGETQSTAAGQC
ncbi:MAG: lysophospholipid acyltransferase family protein [Gemmataceae bacterium]